MGDRQNGFPIKALWSDTTYLPMCPEIKQANRSVLCNTKHAMGRNALSACAQDCDMPQLASHPLYERYFVNWIRANTDIPVSRPGTQAQPPPPPPPPPPTPLLSGVIYVRGLQETTAADIAKLPDGLRTSLPDASSCLLGDTSQHSTVSVCPLRYPTAAHAIPKKLSVAWINFVPGSTRRHADVLFPRVLKLVAGHSDVVGTLRSAQDLLITLKTVARKPFWLTAGVQRLMGYVLSALGRAWTSVRMYSDDMFG